MKDVKDMKNVDFELSCATNCDTDSVNFKAIHLNTRSASDRATWESAFNSTFDAVDDSCIWSPSFSAILYATGGSDEEIE